MSFTKINWVYVLDSDEEVNVLSFLPQGFHSNYAFEDSSGQRRFEIFANGTIRVLKNYAWDGCTPKFAIWDLLIGTPDGAPNHHTKHPKTYFASLFHDVMYQFMDEGSPITKAAADRIFLHLLTRDGFAPRHVYYWAVSTFGGMFHQITKRKRKYNGRCTPLASTPSTRPQAFPR